MDGVGGGGRVLGEAAATAALAKVAKDLNTGEGGGSCGLNSFRADTPVATDQGEQPIGTLQVGDHVLAYNEATGSTGSYTITAVMVHVDPVLVDLTLDGERIETTPYHPFFTAERGWVDAGKLWIGGHIRTADGGAGAVQAMVVEQRSQVMYNLTVAVAHTSFVGVGRWLVHNACNPFKGRTPEQIDERFKAKGFEPKGPDPVNGEGGYVNPQTGRSYHIDPGGTYRKGIEQPHVDVNRPRGYRGPLGKRKFPLGE